MRTGRTTSRVPTNFRALHEEAWASLPIAWTTRADLADMDRLLDRAERLVVKRNARVWGHLRPSAVQGPALLTRH
jgi:hypothetical protein